MLTEKLFSYQNSRTLRAKIKQSVYQLHSKSGDSVNANTFHRKDLICNVNVSVIKVICKCEFENVWGRRSTSSELLPLTAVISKVLLNPSVLSITQMEIVEIEFSAIKY